MAVYIASDLHLGAPTPDATREREKRFIAWLDEIKHDADEIILLGDIFDFWFEYRNYISRYYVRLLGKLAELRDSGIPITFFPGNHDFWTLDFFPKELGIPIVHGGQTREFYGHLFYLHHGDTLGPGDYVFKVVRYVIGRAWFKWVYRQLPADLGYKIADFYMTDSRNRSAKRGRYKEDYGDKEIIWRWVSKQQGKGDRHAYYIFGHRHHAKFRPLPEGGHFIVLGEWISKNTYLKITPESVQLLRYHATEPHIVVASKQHASSEAELMQEIGI
jgi:UDP-2,3-diacylglucosamine hydrolase